MTAAYLSFPLSLSLSAEALHVTEHRIVMVLGELGMVAEKIRGVRFVTRDQYERLDRIFNPPPPRRAEKESGR
ncbi:MAG: hypothetical protein ABSE73_12815 [Planctomycetota bacterium]